MPSPFSAFNSSVKFAVMNFGSSTVVPGLIWLGNDAVLVQQALRRQQQRVDLELIALDMLRESQYPQFFRCKRHGDLPSWARPF